MAPTEFCRINGLPSKGLNLLLAPDKRIIRDGVTPPPIGLCVLPTITERSTFYFSRGKQSDALEVSDRKKGGGEQKSWSPQFLQGSIKLSGGFKLVSSNGWICTLLIWTFVTLENGSWSAANFCDAFLPFTEPWRGSGMLAIISSG